MKIENTFAHTDYGIVNSYQTFLGGLKTSEISFESKLSSWAGYIVRNIPFGEEFVKIAQVAGIPN